MNLLFCRKCLYATSHPLGLSIDKDGICSGCKVHEEKYEIDWDYKWKELKNLLKEYRSVNKNSYDCIVPVSGNGDSYFVLHIVKNLLDMNPLVVNYNTHFNTEIGISNLANLRIKFNCDMLRLTVDPKTIKKITRESLFLLNNIYWHVEAGKSTFPVQIAVKYKIPLIIWGAHQGVEQVGMFSHHDSVEMSRWYRKNHDLMGIDPEDFIQRFNILNTADIYNFLYPQDNIIHQIGVRGIYLNNYLNWNSKKQNELMIKLFNLRTAMHSRSFDPYEYTDCFNYMNIHDILKIFKHGYSKVTDHATREIRFKRMNRNEAIKIVKQYESNMPLYLSQFTNWLSVDKKSFSFTLSKMKNPLFWRNRDYGEDIFRGWSTYHTIEEKNASKIRLPFIVTDKQNQGNLDKYILIGKGFS